MAIRWEAVGYAVPGGGWCSGENDEEAQVGDVSLTVEEYPDYWEFLVEVPTHARNIEGTRKTKAAAKRAAEAAGRRWAMKQARAWGIV